MFDSPSNKFRNQIYGLLTNRYAVGCFLMLTLQQVIEASSTIWLVKLMQSVTGGEVYIPFLILYLGSLAAPYIPNCLAVILKINWRQEAQRSFINAFVHSNKNNIGEWGNKGLKEEKMSILTSEGPVAIYALIDYVYDVYWYTLSVILNILTLSIVVEPLYSLSYALSVISVVIVLKLKRRAQRHLTQRALTARIDLGQSLLGAWDNVLLGNNHNFHIWQDKTTYRMDRCQQRNVELERFDQLMAIFVALMTSVPSLIVVVYYVIRNQSNLELLSSMVVTLPVLFLILSYTYQTLSLIFRWTMHRGKFSAIYRTIQAAREASTSLEKKVKWGKITHEPQVDRVSLSGPLPLQSHLDLLKYTSQPGRITLRGENGSGKSTALMLIKNSLADRAFFLPTHTQLSFIAETNKYSTGESLKKKLLEILEKVDVDVLLLDEWDANLDKENSEIMSQLLDHISKKKCVIEVRHR